MMWLMEPLTSGVSIETEVKMETQPSQLLQPKIQLTRIGHQAFPVDGMIDRNRRNQEVKLHAARLQHLDNRADPSPFFRAVSQTGERCCIEFKRTQVRTDIGPRCALREEIRKVGSQCGYIRP